MASPAIDPLINDDAGVPHVPARQVLASAVALWLCYFVLITMRALVVELGEFSDLLWRRALVTLAGIVVTMLAWPLLRRFDGRPTSVRLAAALVIMLPAALALAMVNQEAFAPVEAQMIARLTDQTPPPNAPVPPLPPHAHVRIAHDPSGNVLVDLGGVEFIASLGLRMLISTARMVQQRGRVMVLYNATPAVSEVLATVALDRMLPVVPDEAEALARLPAAA